MPQYVNKNVIAKLIATREKRIDVALAGNPMVPVEYLEKFLSQNEEAVYKALASNRNINNSMFEALAGKSDAVIELLLVWQKIDKKRLDFLISKNLRLFTVFRYTSIYIYILHYSLNMEILYLHLI